MNFHSNKLPINTELTSSLTSWSLRFVSPANITVADPGASCIFSKTIFNWFIRSLACPLVLSKWEVIRPSSFPDTLTCNKINKWWELENDPLLTLNFVSRISNYSIDWLHSNIYYSETVSSAMSLSLKGQRRLPKNTEQVPTNTARPNPNVRSTVSPFPMSQVSVAPSSILLQHAVDCS